LVRLLLLAPGLCRSLTLRCSLAPGSTPGGLLLAALPLLPLSLEPAIGAGPAGFLTPTGAVASPAIAALAVVRGSRWCWLLC